MENMDLIAYVKNVVNSFSSDGTKIPDGITGMHFPHVGDTIEVIKSERIETNDILLFLSDYFNIGTTKEGYFSIEDGDSSVKVDIISDEDDADVGMNTQFREKAFIPFHAAPKVKPLPKDIVITAIYSFNGDIDVAAYTNHIIEGKFLVVDTNVESPVVDNSVVHSFSFDGLLNLIYADSDANSSNAVNIAKNTLVGKDGVYHMPGVKRLEDAAAVLVTPQDISNSYVHNDCHLTDVIYDIGERLGVDSIVINLAPGFSEYSAPFLFDPRIKKVFLSKDGSEEGNALVIASVNKRFARHGLPPIDVTNVTI